MAIATALTVASTLIGGAMTIEQAVSQKRAQKKADIAQKASYEEQKATAEFNAEATRAQASAVRRESAERLRVFDEETGRFQGRQKTLFGSAGVELTTGSPLAVTQQTIETQERERQFLKEGGELEVQALEKQAEFQEERAKGYGTLIEELFAKKRRPAQGTPATTTSPFAGGFGQ